MFGHDNHRHTDEAGAGETSGMLLGKSEALALFFRLQSSGYLPCMVEEESGRYRVFVGDRLN